MNDIDDLVDDVQEVAESVMQLGMKKTLGFAGILSGVFGFIADVLQPIAPFAIYLLIASVLMLVGSIIWYIKAKKGMILGIISLCCSVVLGGITLLQNITDAEEEGFASKTLPGIAKLQSAIGILDKKLDDIKQDTEQLKSDTSELKNSTKELANKSDDILDSTATLVEKTDIIADTTDAILEQAETTQESLDQIETSIEGIANNGGIKKNPTSAEDFYHNAKIHELSGDYGNAKRSYQSYFKFKTEKLDPHLRLTDFLTINEGKNGAREIYQLIVKGNETPISQLVSSTLYSSREVRVDKLIEFRKKHPNFTPAAYFLSKEFSLDRLGKQSLSDKRNEYKWLSLFNEDNKEGGLVKWFVDKELLGEWQSDVSERLKLAEASKHQFNNPVSITWTAHNGGFSGYIQITEPVTKIEYRKQGEETFIDLGEGTYLNTSTGKNDPNRLLSLPIDQQPQVFEIRYTDQNDQTSDIFEVAIEEKHIKGFQVTNGKVEIDKNMLNTLNIIKTSWVAFQAPTGNTNLYFSMLMPYRGILKKIEYGLDTEVPNKEWDFPVYDKAGISPITADMKIYLDVPNHTKFATVQLTFKDDTKSEIVKVNNLVNK